MRAILTVLLLIALGYLWQTQQIPLDPWAAEEAITSQTLPWLYGLTLVILCLAGLVTSVLRERHTTNDLGRAAPFQLPPGGWLRVAGLAAAMLLFALLVPRLGIWLAIPFLLLPAMWVMGERRWLVLFAAPAGMALFGYLIVVQGLGLYVEPGSWLL
jgi:hypothetical protein